jgi:DNA-binding IscR family transcriptional regulator
MSEAADKFARGAGGADLTEIAVRCDVPREWIDSVYRSLADAGLLARLAESEQVIPKRPPAQIKTLDVMRALDKGEADAFLEQIRLRPEMEKQLQILSDAEDRALTGGLDGKETAEARPKPVGL